MAHTLQIVYGGTTLDLNDGSDMKVMQYDIGTPRLNQDTITEVIKLRINSSSVANLQGEIQNINRALLQATERRGKQRGDRVYLTRQLEGEANTYRSEIFTIESWAGKSATNSKPYWDENLVVYYVRVVRKAYWENVSETEISLANASGSGTGGRKLYSPSNLTPEINGIATISYDTTDDSINDSGSGLGNFGAGDVIIVRGSTSNDGVYTIVTAAAGKLTVVENLTTEIAGDTTYIYEVQDYVHIAAADVVGDMEAPCRIEITNDYATQRSYQFYVGHNILSNPGSLSHLLEAEHASAGLSSVEVSATSSGGEFGRKTWAGDDETTIADWTLSTEFLDMAAGGDFRVIARFVSSVDLTDIQFRLKVMFSVTELYVGKVVQPDSAKAWIIRDLGVVTLPPWFQDSGTTEPITLRLTGKIAGGGFDLTSFNASLTTSPGSALGTSTIAFEAAHLKSSITRSFD